VTLASNNLAIELFFHVPNSSIEHSIATEEASHLKDFVAALAGGPRLAHALLSDFVIIKLSASGVNELKTICTDRASSFPA
jgi:hypothetical protein